MPESKRIVIVAGEESGDVHAASLIHSLKARHPQVQFSGIGGRHMQEAGADLVFDLASHGVTGFSEVIKHIGLIRRAFKVIKAHLSHQKPDLLILVDYPGFNLRLARFAKRVLGIKILYYISPQIWAWKANRIHIIRECVDKMAVIFPFEKELYQKAGVPVNFVGHPLVEKIKPSAISAKNPDSLKLPAGKRIIAWLPGSRSNEVEQHMPVFVQTMQRLLKQDDSLHFVIPIAGTIDPEAIKSHMFQISPSDFTLVQGHALEIISSADFVIVASGTASLECALLEKPMCIVYKSSFLTYLLAAKLIRVNYLGLCNLLSNRMLVPELLQYDFNAEELTKQLSYFLEHPMEMERMKNDLHQLRINLSQSNADSSLCEVIEQQLGLL